MWLKSIEVVNLGPFVEFKTKLKRGSIGIFGKNGSGKSTLCNLMYGLIGGDFGRFGVKLDAIRNTAEKKDKSYVTGVVAHGDDVVSITRNFRPTKADPIVTVVINDDKPITDGVKAQKALNELFGVDDNMLDRYVFKRAEAMYDFINDIPSVRAKQLQILCRTENCEAIYEMLGRQLTAIPVGRDDGEDDSDVLAQELSAAEQAKEELTGRREDVAAKLVKPKFVTAYEDVLRAEQRRADAAKQLPAATTKLQAAEDAFETAEKAWIAANQEADAVRTACRAAAKDRPAKQRRLAEIEAAIKIETRVAKLKRTKAELATEGRGRKAPKAPDMDRKQTLLAWRQESMAALARAKETLAKFEDTGLAACPTCSTPVAKLEGYLETCRGNVSSIPEDIAKFNEELRRIQEEELAASTYTKWKADYDKRVAANAAELEGIGEYADVDLEEKQELESWLNDLAEQEEDLAVKEASAATLDRTQQRKKTDRSVAIAERNKLVKAVEENETEDGEVDKANRRLEEHRKAELELARIDGELKVHSRVIDAKKEAITALRVKAARTRKLKQLSSIVEAVREVFHRNNLPRLVAKENLSRMEGEINDGLEGFDSPFWVETDDQLTFIAHKPGEPPMAAKQLSTGQKSILGVSFWRAVATLWAGDLGMLALDEPTANLDADNRKLLAASISGVSAKIRNRQQLIMVTHDHDLRSSFDQVIDLDA